VSALSTAVLLIGVVRLVAQGSSQDMTPAFFKLPDKNFVSAPQDEIRVYLVDPETRRRLPAAQQQAAAYPKIPKIPREYVLGDDEGFFRHGALDLTSRPDGDGNLKLPLEFQAGIYGKVVYANPSDPLGRVIIEVDQRGNHIEFLHLSEIYLSPGTQVTPSTVVGKTGSKGAGAIHLSSTSSRTNERLPSSMTPTSLPWAVVHARPSRGVPS
jgi:murein DD-endopeptidase MepM/ murein hydrolase activator NlpD